MNKSFLTGVTVHLRPLTESDLTTKYRDWFNDEEVCQFNSHHRFPNYNEDMHAYYETTIRSHENLILAICDNETDTHVGNVSLQGINLLDRSAEFAIVIGEKTSRNRGVGVEVMQLILRHAFDQLNLNRVYCGTADNNIGMQRLALSTGFVEEGRSRQALFKNGAFHDIIHYGVLAHEYKAIVGGIESQV